MSAKVRQAGALPDDPQVLPGLASVSRGDDEARVSLANRLLPLVSIK